MVFTVIVYFAVQAMEHPATAAGEGDGQQRDVTTTDYAEAIPHDEER